MKDILTILKETTDCEYRVNTTKTESYELFFVHKKAETVRSSDSTTRSVTLYADHDGYKGDYSFRVSASDSEARIADKIRAAEKQAKLICNQAYSLPAKETLDCDIPSNFSSLPMSELAAQIAEACFAADTLENGSINALEVFVYRETVTVENSNGLVKREHKYSAMVEAIPTWNENGDSVELYEAHRFTQFDAKSITEEIAEKLREVRDRYHAKKPASSLDVPVVFRAAELANLCNELASDLQYSAVYGKTNLFSKGDVLQKRTDGDPLTLEAKAEVPGSRYSAAFDADGSSLIDTTLVEGGVVQNYFGGTRFAQYLSEPCTGALPCVRLHAGTLSEDELRRTPHLVCASMSGLQLDLYNDYIGGEIRLAYLVEGDKATPITGISVSGKLSDALASLRLSSCETMKGNYYGPDKALCKGLKIF